MAAFIIYKKLCFEDSLKVHNIHTKLHTKLIICDSILYGMVCGILGKFDGFWTLGLHVPLTIV